MLSNLLSETMGRKKESGKNTFEKISPPENKLNILHIAAEVSPISNVGGLSQVVSHLAKAQANRGHDVRIFMPKYGFIDERKFKTETVYKGLRVATGYTKNDEHPAFLICNVKKYVREDNVII